MTFKDSSLISDELPYYGQDIILSHGQFNNSLSYHLPTRNCLEGLSSIYDLDLFNLNTHNPNIDPDCNLLCNQIRCNYYSPYKFAEFTKKLESKNCLSIFHNNIRSLSKNLEDFQNHLFHEFDFNFSIIGLTETRITSKNDVIYNLNIPGYSFEYVLTPLSAGGVAIYVKDHFNYRVLEKTSNVSYQAMWIEIQFSKRKNVICGIIYRQHNSPEKFQEYFDSTVEKYSAFDKPIYIMGDFNINLLKFESCRFAK